MKENNPHILGEAPIGKLLVEYSIPAIIGMTLTSLYNIIDSIFIGHGVGALAISGLAITFPLMNLLVAFCTLVGVGNAIFYGGLAFIFLEPILFFFGASEATLPYARDFMQVILLGSPISASQHATETAHHSQHFCHRHVALRHECVCLLHRDFHQQPSAQLWR